MASVGHPAWVPGWCSPRSAAFRGATPCHRSSACDCDLTRCGRLVQPATGVRPHYPRGSRME
eukprot:15214821-Alexandrium_andersonii.AAC.1